MIDNYSQGRLEVGFVRGVPYEISAANASPVRTMDRLWEAHDLIVKAWTTHDAPFNWEGRYFNHRQVNVWPRPYQEPHPPVWIASTTASLDGADRRARPCHRDVSHRRRSDQGRFRRLSRAPARARPADDQRPPRLFRHRLCRRHRRGRPGRCARDHVGHHPQCRRDAVQDTARLYPPARGFRFCGARRGSCTASRTTSKP